jgi:hypothetical protein
MKGMLTLPAGRPAENSSGVLCDAEGMACVIVCAQEQKSQQEEVILLAAHLTSRYL